MSQLQTTEDDRPDDAELLRELDQLGRPRVLVVGDAILDRYTWGDAERISQEAPVIVLRTEHREARPGGAANVCRMLSGLEAAASVACVVGGDSDGSVLAHLLEEAGIDSSLLFRDPDRPTSVKERFIGRAQGRHAHQILRVDREVRSPLDPPLERQIIERLVDVVGSYDVVLISDYDKGVCSSRLVQAIVAASNRADVPVVVDPARHGDYRGYHGATAVTPNRIETEQATQTIIHRAEDALAAGQELCRRFDLEMAVVTLDAEGMALVRRDGGGRIFPTRPRAVYDITGAGDIVLAMIGICLACGMSPDVAVSLGNVAGGLEVEQQGVAVIHRDQIRSELCGRHGRQAVGAGRHTAWPAKEHRPGAPHSISKGAIHLEATPESSRQTPPRHVKNSRIVTLDQMVAEAARHRQRGEQVVLTNGCFDLLHIGHASYLALAKELGDVLVVAVNSDAGIRRLKGAGRPIIPQRDRAAMLAALASVDYVLIFDEDTPHELLRKIRPDVLVKGGTYTPAEVVGAEVVTAYGGRVCVTQAVEGVSTTAILDSLARREAVAMSSRIDGPSQRPDAAPPENMRSDAA